MIESLEAEIISKVNEEFEEAFEVYKTTDLSIFKQIKGNRPRNPQHISQIKNSIKKHGMLFRPLLVNEKYEVLDGQHRLEAAKETCHFVYYIILEGRGLGSVHVLNLNQQNWGQVDFLNSYAEMGLVDYLALKSFWERHKDFKLGDCMMMCTNSHIVEKHNMDVNISKRFFKEGVWRLLDMDQAERYISKLEEIKPYYKNYNRSTFVSTMIDCFHTENFDFSVFMQKLKLRPSVLIDCSTKDQYIDLIEDIYNYKNQNKINLRYGN
jgi:hypothetical protein